MGYKQGEEQGFAASCSKHVTNNGCCQREGKMDLRFGVGA